MQRIIPLLFALVFLTTTAACRRSPPQPESAARVGYADGVLTFVSVERSAGEAFVFVMISTEVDGRAADPGEGCAQVAVVEWQLHDFEVPIFTVGPTIDGGIELDSVVKTCESDEGGLMAEIRWFSPTEIWTSGPLNVTR